jgi:hypothetical protein
VEQKKQRSGEVAAAAAAVEAEEEEQELKDTAAEEEEEGKAAPKGIQPLPTAILEHWVASKGAEAEAERLAQASQERKPPTPGGPVRPLNTKTLFRVVPLTRKARQDRAGSKARVPEEVAHFRRDRMAAIPRTPFSLVR